MTQIATVVPGLGELNTQADPEIRNALQAIINVVNGQLDAGNILNNSLTEDELTSSLAQKVGLSQAGVVRRGKSIIVTTESRANVAYGLLPTPDRVQNVVLPTDGLIAVLYQATWQESVLSAGKAAIFIGANQLQHADSQQNAPVVDEASCGGATAAQDTPLVSHALGLFGTHVASHVYSGDVTTGQALGVFETSATPQRSIGGPCYIEAAAGAYDISVQFKASSGSVTVKNRKLWVWTIAF